MELKPKQPIKTAEELFHERRAQVLSSSHFPDEFISDGFRDILRKAIMYCSLYKIGCPMLTWRQFIVQDRVFYMAEMLLCFDVLRGATPIELNQSLQDNLQMHERIVTPMREKWLELEHEYLEPVKREIDAKLKISGNSPIGHQILKP